MIWIDVLHERSIQISYIIPTVKSIGSIGIKESELFLKPRIGGSAESASEQSKSLNGDTQKSVKENDRQHAQKEESMKRTWIMAFFIGTALLAASCGQDTAESGTNPNQAEIPESDTCTDQTKSSGSAVTPDRTKSSASGSTDTENTGADGSVAGSKPNTEEKTPYIVTDTRFEYYLNTIGQVEYHALVEVENTGKYPLYLQGAVYDFEDMEGHLAWTDDFISSCPNVIGPGEKGWFYNSIGASGAGDIDSSAEYQFVPTLKIVRSNADPVFYEVSDTSLSTNALGYPAVTGRVRNTTDKADQLVNLHAVFYGNDGKVIGISGMTMMDLGPDEQRSFEITGLDLSSSVREAEISDYKVIASKAHFQV